MSSVIVSMANLLGDALPLLALKFVLAFASSSLASSEGLSVVKFSIFLDGLSLPLFGMRNFFDGPQLLHFKLLVVDWLIFLRVSFRQCNLREDLFGGHKIWV